MRILLSGGEKTENILKGVSKKFKSSGDEFMVVNYIDDIDSIFSKGDFFDKALITEQSLTKEYQITDESALRNRINQFAIESANRLRHSETFVFLTQDEKIAMMISEEIMKIEHCSVVVLKKPPYSVQFFVSLIVNDKSQIDQNIVFKPEAVVSAVQVSTEQETLANSEVMNVMQAPQNMDNALFGDELQANNYQFGESAQPMGGFDNNFNGGMNNGFDTSMGNDFTGDMGFNNQADNMFDNAQDFNNQPMPDFNNQMGMDNQMNNQPMMDQMGMGGQINNQPMDTQGNVTMNISQFDKSSFDQGVTPNNEGANFIPGFDEDDYSGGNDDLYNGYNDTTGVPSANTADMSGMAGAAMMGAAVTGAVAAQSIAGFDDYDNNEYNNQYNNQNQMSNNGAIQGFDDYSNGNEQMQTGYNNQYQMNNQQMQMANNGMNQSDFDSNDMAMAGLAIAGAMAGAMANNRNNRQNNRQQQQMNNNRQANPNQMRNSFGGRISVAKAKEALKPFAARGNSIVVTGCGGCGTSFVSYSLASILSQLGFNTLLIDMDTKGRTQHYISRANYDSMESDGANLMAAVNSSNGITSQLSVVRQGLHLLTMGIGADGASVDELIHKEKLNRFTNLAKTSHNFVIYDIPFGDATNFLSDVTYTSDNIVLVTDASHWGVAKTMLSVCNIASEDMQDVIFKRAQIVFNRYRNVSKIFGNKVRTATDILKAMDKQVLELIGDDPGFYFESMKISGIINDDPRIEDGWFENVQYSDTKRGQEIFLELIYNIVMNK